MRSSPSDVTLGIKEAADRFGLAPHVLRHWESMGLLSPRRQGDRRRYTEDDLYRIAAVIRAKQVDLALDDIGALLRTEDSGSRGDILRRHRSVVLKRMEDARRALELVDHALDCPHENISCCPRFRASLSDLVGPERDGDPPDRCPAHDRARRSPTGRPGDEH